MSSVLSGQATGVTGDRSEQQKSATRGAMQQTAVPITSVHHVEADGVRVFYREAGNVAAPVVLLLHGA